MVNIRDRKLFPFDFGQNNKIPYSEKSVNDFFFKYQKSCLG